MLMDNVSTIKSGMNRQMRNMNLLPLITHVVKAPFLVMNRIMIATAHTDSTDAAMRAPPITPLRRRVRSYQVACLPREDSDPGIAGRAPAGEARGRRSY